MRIVNRRNRKLSAIEKTQLARNLTTLFSRSAPTWMKARWIQLELRERGIAPDNVNELLRLFATRAPAASEDQRAARGKKSSKPTPRKETTSDDAPRFEIVDSGGGRNFSDEPTIPDEIDEEMIEVARAVVDLSNPEREEEDIAIVDWTWSSPEGSPAGDGDEEVGEKHLSMTPEEPEPLPPPGDETAPGEQPAAVAEPEEDGDAHPAAEAPAAPETVAEAPPTSPAGLPVEAPAAPRDEKQDAASVRAEPVPDAGVDRKNRNSPDIAAIVEQIEAVAPPRKIEEPRARVASAEARAGEPKPSKTAEPVVKNADEIFDRYAGQSPLWPPAPAARGGPPATVSDIYAAYLQDVPQRDERPESSATPVEHAARAVDLPPVAAAESAQQNDEPAFAVDLIESHIPTAADPVLPPGPPPGEPAGLEQQARKGAAKDVEQSEAIVRVHGSDEGSDEQAPEAASDEMHDAGTAGQSPAADAPVEQGVPPVPAVEESPVAESGTDGSILQTSARDTEHARLEPEEMAAPAAETATPAPPATVAQDAAANSPTSEKISSADVEIRPEPAPHESAADTSAVSAGKKSGPEPAPEKAAAKIKSASQRGKSRKKPQEIPVASSGKKPVTSLSAPSPATEEAVTLARVFELASAARKKARSADQDKSGPAQSAQTSGQKSAVKEISAAIASVRPEKAAPAVQNADSESKKPASSGTRETVEKSASVEGDKKQVAAEAARAAPDRQTKRVGGERMKSGVNPTAKKTSAGGTENIPDASTDEKPAATSSKPSPSAAKEVTSTPAVTGDKTRSVKLDKSVPEQASQAAGKKLSAKEISVAVASDRPEKATPAAVPVQASQAPGKKSSAKDIPAAVTSDRPEKAAPAVQNADGESKKPTSSDARETGEKPTSVERDIKQVAAEADRAAHVRKTKHASGKRTKPAAGTTAKTDRQPSASAAAKNSLVTSGTEKIPDASADEKPVARSTTPPSAEKEVTSAPEASTEKTRSVQPEKPVRLRKPPAAGETAAAGDATAKSGAAAARKTATKIPLDVFDEIASGNGGRGQSRVQATLPSSATKPAAPAVSRESIKRIGEDGVTDEILATAFAEIERCTMEAVAKIRADDYVAARSLVSEGIAWTTVANSVVVTDADRPVADSSGLWFLMAAIKAENGESALALDMLARVHTEALQNGSAMRWDPHVRAARALMFENMPVRKWPSRDVRRAMRARRVIRESRRNIA